MGNFQAMRTLFIQCFVCDTADCLPSPLSLGESEIGSERKCWKLYTVSWVGNVERCTHGFCWELRRNLSYPPYSLKIVWSTILLKLPEFNYSRTQVKQITFPPSGFVNSQKGRDSQSRGQVMSIICIFPTYSCFFPLNMLVSSSFTLKNPPSWTAVLLLLWRGSCFFHRFQTLMSRLRHIIFFYS